MLTFQETYERICEVTGVHTQMELANLLSIRQSSISDAKRRNSIPADWYMKLFEKFGISPNWLKYGTGPRYLNQQEPLPVAPAGHVLREADATFGSPLARSTVATVYGMFCPSEETADTCNFPVEGRIALPLEYAGKDILIFHVESESFTPTIRKGAYIGVNRLQCYPVPGELYAVRVPYEGVALKRLYLDSDKELFILRTDSQGYPESFLTAAQCRDRLLGKVIWVLQSL